MVVFGDFLHHFLRTLDGVEGAFFLAAAIRIRNEPTIPPTALHSIKKMMDNAVDKRRGEDLANHGVENDERNRRAGLVVISEYGFGEVENVLGPVDVVAVFIKGVELVLASLSERNSKLF